MAPHLLTSMLDVGDWPASCLGHFTPPGKAPLELNGLSLGEPQSQSGCRGVQKGFLPLLGIEPQPSSVQPVATPTELSV
jgi:hypothetical protein